MPDLTTLPHGLDTRKASSLAITGLFKLGGLLKEKHGS
jgi:hypothetical protein